MSTLHHVLRAKKVRSKVEAKARKLAGINPGDEYWWWKTRRKSKGSISGVKHYSKVKPRESQLTTSTYKRAYWLIIEKLYDLVGDVEYLERELVTVSLKCRVDEFDDLITEQYEGLESIPDSLSSSPTAEKMRVRILACRDVRDLINIAISDIGSLSSSKSISDILSSLIAAIPSPE